MLYKAIILALFASLNVYINDINAQSTHEEYIRQLAHVSELGKKIDDKHKYIQSIRADAVNFIFTLFTRKGLKDDDSRKFVEKIDAEDEQFRKAFLDALFVKHDCQGFLFKELFQFNIEDQEEEFKIFKFAWARMEIEFAILKNYVQEYEQACMQLAAIHNELNNINN